MMQQYPHICDRDNQRAPGGGGVKRIKVEDNDGCNTQRGLRTLY